MEPSLSLEETNKIRISLGLKPLTDDGAPVDNKEKAAEDNYAAQKEQDDKAKRANEISARIAKSKNKAELNRRLLGSTLGAADPDDDDTLKWIKKSKRREKELAKKRQAEMDNMDKMIQEEYTEKDLEGLKVSHDLDELQEGEARILTLKDSRILDNEEDELHNVDMAEDEGDKKRLELKTKRKDYTGYDDDEFAPGMEGRKRGVLSKYDVDIEGPTETGFRLGAGGSTQGVKAAPVNSTDTETVNRSLLTIDYTKNIEISDYLQEGDVGFKKPKTKKKRAARRVPERDADAPTNGNVDSQSGETPAMEVDVKTETLQQPNLDTNFVDDDDLQAVLAQNRRRMMRKQAKKVTAEEIAEQVIANRTADENIAEAVSGVSGADGGLTIDETSEFVRSIAYAPAPVKTEAPPDPVIVRIDTSGLSRDADGNIEMGEAGDEALTEMELNGDSIKDEEMDDDEAAMMLREIERGLGIESGEVKSEGTNPADIEIGTSGEQMFSSGLAATLNILRQQGVLAGPSEDVVAREKAQRAKDHWLAQRRYALAQRELDRLRARSSNKDQATREYENRQREAQEAREALDSFNDYKPDVDIKYHDEFGRELTPHEAWKALSHKFHGKAPGRMKQEKRLKKIEEEKKRAAMGSGDTPLSMQAAFQMRQEKAGQAHMVLSVGNRGAVPQATEFLDSGFIAKEKKDKGKKSKKDKTSTPGPSYDITGFTATAPSVSSSFPSLLDQPSSLSASPAPRPGFARIGSISTPADTGVSSPAGSSVPEDRRPLQIGFGKRKATDEGTGTPNKRHG